MNRPPIVCFCGSTRFKEVWEAYTRYFTLSSFIVLGVAFYMHADGIKLSPVEKARLDDLHKRKIDLADSVFILDVGGYIGESTKSEIGYALFRGKPVRFLSGRVLEESFIRPAGSLMTCPNPACRKSISRADNNILKLQGNTLYWRCPECQHVWPEEVMKP